MKRLERKIVMYLSAELLVAVAAILGNGFVAIVYIRDRRLRTPTNLYIFSLAIVNLLTSVVAIPAYLNSLINPHSHDFDKCLYVNVSLVTFCTISILHLVAVSFDRYIALVWNWKPSSHTRGMVHAVSLTLVAWILGGLIGCLPLMGWSKEAPKNKEFTRCEFLKVIEPGYLLLIFYATVLTPSILLIFFYISIYRVLRSRSAFKHKASLARAHDALDTRMSVKKKGMNEVVENNEEMENEETNEMQLGRIADLRRITFSLLLVIIFFHICWYPLHIMNVISYYVPKYYFLKWHFYVPIVLSHASNAINPLIYGLAMPRFKEAFLDALICKEQTDVAGDKATRRSMVLRQA